VTLFNLRGAGRAAAGAALAVSLVLAAGLTSANAAVVTSAPADSAAWQVKQNAAQDALQAKESADDNTVAAPSQLAGQAAASPEGLKADSLTESSAITGAQFNAGNIISNNNFFNGSAMTASAVQTFLNTEGAACKASTPVCLKNFSADTLVLPPLPTETPANAVCNTYPGTSSDSAAEIIAKAGIACGISQRVLLATIQKESGLVTTTAPTAAMYETTTGYGCPDTSVCATQYFGFFNQVLWTAWQLKRYTNPPGTDPSAFTRFPVGKTTSIAYSPSASCGGANVYILNVATAALYYYTPYQPNAAALANLYGSGDACSSYGNRNFWTIYNGWFGSPTQVPTVTRTSGADRIGTAIAISKASYPGTKVGVPVVYIATGENFPDALSAAPAAAEQKGPLLLVDPGPVPVNLTDELTRLAPAKIVVVGGTSAISAADYATLSAFVASSPDISRIAGIDRYDTSRQIASAEFPHASTARAYLATGANFPDALSAGAAAGSQKSPVILVDNTETAVDTATRQLLKTLGVTTATIVGGSSAIPSAYQTSLASVVHSVGRLSGADRYATSAAINTANFPNASRVFLATGADFPDALAGAAAAGAAASPLFVVQPTCVPSESRSAIFATGPTSVTLFGGTSALSSNVAALGSC
jgi:putative cell wall-binding protein